MRKTLGGDRLGSGKKMQVDLHGYERSTHDLGFIWRSTMSAGTLVPFLNIIGLPGDTFDIDLDVDLKTHPTIGPLFGSYKVQLDTFVCPLRLYNAQLHNNTLGVGNRMQDIKFPQITFQVNQFASTMTDQDNSQVNPSCVLKYLGWSGIGVTATDGVTRSFNASPILALWDIYKNYYANKQEEIGAVIHSGSSALIASVDTIFIGPDEIFEVPTSGPPINLTTGSSITITYTGGTPPLLNQIVLITEQHGPQTIESLISSSIDDGINTIDATYDWTTWGTISITNWRYINANDIVNSEIQVATFPLSNIDDMRMEILKHWSTTAFNLNTTPATPIEPYVWLNTESNNRPYRLSSQEGLPVKTYQNDLFNNWVRTEWLDDPTTGISAVTAIDTSGGSFTIDTLNISKKVYNMLMRVAVSDGTYDSWLDVTYDEERYIKAESPMYMGGLIKELVFQEVVSNADTADQPLGSLAGKGIMGSKHKGGHVYIKTMEPSIIMGLISLTPRIDYSQGNDWAINLISYDDLHKPELDEIGFEDSINELRAWWSTEWDGTKWVQTSAGKIPAWLNYMTAVNKTYGNFAITDNEMFMTLNRRYTPTSLGSNVIQDLTTYIDPSKFNFIFAQTSIDSQNFWAQIKCDITARRKMSGKLMPNV